MSQLLPQFNHLRFLSRKIQVMSASVNIDIVNKTVGDNMKLRMWVIQGWYTMTNRRRFSANVFFFLKLL